MLFMVRPDVKSAHLLADLLETIEVTADELMDQKLAGRELAAIRAMSDVEVEAHLAELRRFVQTLRELELMIIAKLGQAREKARTVARSDWRLRPIMMLFTSGTQSFADRFEVEPSPQAQGFDGAHQIFPYLRGRGLVSPQATHYDGSAELIVTDSFRLLGAMPLRDLRERCEATLNALDAHYDLYDLEDDTAEVSAATVVPLRIPKEAAAPVSLPPAAEAKPSEPAEAVPAAAQVDFGNTLGPSAAVSAPDVQPDAASQTSAVTEAAPAASAEAELAAAQAASEVGLKGLTERLAELKADTSAEAATTPEPKPATAA
jgi:hypothetical protein